MGKRRTSRMLVAVAIAATSMTLGLGGHPAEAASPLGCPNLCLTGGLALLGGRSVLVSGVDAAATEHRDYNYSWLALDLTEFPPVTLSLQIGLSVDGNVSNGVFNGTGEAALYGAGVFYVNGITLTDSGLTVNASGGSGGEMFKFGATVVGGGTATYQNDYDYDWDGCGEC